jgi:hypothetical protein
LIAGMVDLYYNLFILELKFNSLNHRINP